MKILLASPRGFCAGVRMATQALDVALQRLGAPVYVFHEIVHNQHVVQDFEERGAVFVNDVDEVPEGAVLVFSAHGVAPEIREQAVKRRLRTIDAICPLVAKVHTEVIQLAREGCTILLIGHAGHDETVGTMGEAPDAIHLISSVEDVDRVQVAPGTRVAWLTQTTLSVTDTQAIVDRLHQRFPDIKGPPTDDICYATRNRQLAVTELAPEADSVVVVGSRNSSNSQRLREVALQCDVRAWLVDGPEGLSRSDFSPDDTVVLTAGASVPEYAVQAVLDWFRQEFEPDVETRTIREEEQVFALPTELSVDSLQEH